MADAKSRSFDFSGRSGHRSNGLEFKLYNSVRVLLSCFRVLGDYFEILFSDHLAKDATSSSIFGLDEKELAAILIHLLHSVHILKAQ